MITGLLSALSTDARIAIVALNHDIALGALAVFEKTGRLDQVVAVGQGAELQSRDALRRPEFPFIGSTSYEPEKYGAELIDLALKILEGEAIPPAVYREHVFITRESVANYDTNTQEYATV